jgi:hypothetical protein
VKIGLQRGGGDLPSAVALLLLCKRGRGSATAMGKFLAPLPATLPSVNTRVASNLELIILLLYIYMMEVLIFGA